MTAADTHSRLSGVTEDRESSLADTPGRPPGDSFSERVPGGTLKRLDTIVKTGERLGRAIDVASREEIRALADRLDMRANGSTSVLRIQVKRRLVGAGGLVRESRAK